MCLCVCVGGGVANETGQTKNSSRSPPPTPSVISFCAGVEFTCDCLRALKDRVKVQ